MCMRFFFFPGLDGLPFPTTPSTKRARAGQLNNKRKLKGGAQSIPPPAPNLERDPLGDDQRRNENP